MAFEVSLGLNVDFYMSWPNSFILELINDLKIMTGHAMALNEIAHITRFVIYINMATTRYKSGLKYKSTRSVIYR